MFMTFAHTLPGVVELGLMALDLERKASRVWLRINIIKISLTDYRTLPIIINEHSIEDVVPDFPTMSLLDVARHFNSTSSAFTTMANIWKCNYLNTNFVCGMAWYYYISKNELRLRTSQLSVELVRRRTWQWIGHTSPSLIIPLQATSYSGIHSPKIVDEWVTPKALDAE